MKKISLLLVLIFVFSVTLAACSSDTATEAPQEPQPTAVANVPEKPTTDESAAAEEPAAPPEVEVDSSQGLFDTAAMLENLGAYVLRPEDLPNAYKIMADGEQHINNLKVINTVGEVEGKRYIAASTRVDGWSLELQRVNKEELIPYTLYSQIEVFETPEGAQTAFSADWLPVYNLEEGAVQPSFLECSFGDACVMYYYEKLDPATEITTLQYEIVFVYNNVLAQVMARGADYDMNPDFVVNAAQILFDKISAAPMVE